jgi:competence protein ComEC
VSDVAEGSPRGARFDVRLVPPALTSWIVTAVGIVWPVGRLLAFCFVLLTVISIAVWCYAVRRTGLASRLRVISAGLVAIGVVGAGFGFAVAMRADAVARHPIRAAFGTAAPLTVTPSESPVSLGRDRLMFRATLQRLRTDEMSGLVLVFARMSDFDSETGGIMAGRPVQFTARIGRPSRNDLTVAVLNVTGHPSMGRAGAVQRAAHTVRSRFAAAVREVLPGEQAAMLPALVLGDTSAVTAETGREFRAAGMTHLTAVSGANVTIVCGAVLFSARVIGPRAAVLLAAVALLAFVIVVQPTASVLRAAVMAAIALAGVVSSRRRQAIPALSTSVLVLLAVAPQLAVDVGFALSVLATAALVVIAPVWSRRLAGRGWPKPLADAVAVACAAHVVTAPLIAGISGRVSLVGIAANLAAAVAIAPITVLGSAAAALCVLWPAGAQFLIRFTGPELWWVLGVAHWAAGVPMATVAVPPGLPGVFTVGGGTVLAALLALWLRRLTWFRKWFRRWFRTSMRLSATVAAFCLLAWSLSGALLESRS